MKTLIQTVLSGYVLNCSEEQFDTNNCSLQCIDESSAVVKLDLNNLEAYSLFPGKVVGMQGTFMGSLFVPDKIFEPKEPPLASFERQSGTDFLNVWCACGPFTSSTTLSYEQLYDFIELVNKEKPDVLILIGPFIDRTSSVVRSSKCCITYDELMETLLGKIDDALSGSDVQVLIIPNGKKDAALRPSFPTPAFRFLRHQKQLSKKSMIFLPDPAIVRIAGVEFAITASEIIQHLGKNEIGRLDGSENHDRMSRLVRDLFRQRSLYPLYPASDDITYKLRESVERASLLTIPHVIILPSMLTPTVKIVAGSVYVNINALVRGNNSTFMKLKIDFNEIDAKTDNSHTSIADFCEVKIVRL
ncbi:unnamed protein product [Thelazia callipaeda]|uniref:DNA polymerase alpha subunit B n=1 Tax=Thelazia callipaeda TaxID=103827 RepID=A0A0N5D625_THECL|nr:unnamed protein product [Thelazia callipaeda]